MKGRTMGNDSAKPNKDLVDNIVKYLINHIGRKLDVQKIRHDLKLSSKSDFVSLANKLRRLERKGQMFVDRNSEPKTWTPLPSLRDGAATKSSITKQLAVIKTSAPPRRLKPKNHKYASTGISKRLDKYLSNYVGQTVIYVELMDELNFTNQDKSAVSAKLAYLAKQGKIIRDKSSYPADIIVTQSFNKSLPAKQSHKTPKQAFNEPPRLTPQAFTKEVEISNVLQTPPIDIASMMQQVVEISQQNSIYANVFEQIALLLERAGIIEQPK